MDDDGQPTFPQPIGQQLLVKVYDPQTGKWGRNFFGQITVPEGGKPEPARGIVMALGTGQLLVPAMLRVPFDVEQGDEILFYDEFASPVQIDGEKLVMLNEGNVLMIVSRLGGTGLLDRLLEDRARREEDGA